MHACVHVYCTVDCFCACFGACSAQQGATNLCHTAAVVAQRVRRRFYGPPSLLKCRGCYTVFYGFAAGRPVSACHPSHIKCVVLPKRTAPTPLRQCHPHTHTASHCVTLRHTASHSSHRVTLTGSPSQFVQHSRPASTPHNPTQPHTTPTQPHTAPPHSVTAAVSQRPSQRDMRAATVPCTPNTTTSRNALFVIRGWDAECIGREGARRKVCGSISTRCTVRIEVSGAGGGAEGVGMHAQVRLEPQSNALDCTSFHMGPSQSHHYSL